jgi:hypothetical protein
MELGSDAEKMALLMLIGRTCCTLAGYEVNDQSL